METHFHHIPLEWNDRSNAHNSEAKPMITKAFLDFSEQTETAFFTNKDTRPRRPMTAYNFFFKSERQTLSDEYTDDKNQKLRFTELARAVGARWRSLSPEEKQRFEDMASSDKQRYIDEMNDWRNRKLEMEAKAILEYNAKVDTALKATSGHSPSSQPSDSLVGALELGANQGVHKLSSNQFSIGSFLHEPRPKTVHTQTFLGGFEERSSLAAYACRNNTESLRKLARELDTGALNFFINAFKDL